MKRFLIFLLALILIFSNTSCEAEFITDRDEPIGVECCAESGQLPSEPGDDEDNEDEEEETLNKKECCAESGQLPTEPGDDEDEEQEEE